MNFIKIGQTGFGGSPLMMPQMLGQLGGMGGSATQPGLMTGGLPLLFMLYSMIGDKNWQAATTPQQQRGLPAMSEQSFGTAAGSAGAPGQMSASLAKPETAPRGPRPPDLGNIKAGPNSGFQSDNISGTTNVSRV